MRIDFDLEIKVFKHGIKKEENRLHRVTKTSDVIFAGIFNTVQIKYNSARINTNI